MGIRAAALLLWMVPACGGERACIPVSSRQWFSSHLLAGWPDALRSVAGRRYRHSRVQLSLRRRAPRRSRPCSLSTRFAGPVLTLAVCRPNWPHALLALALFRLFDITKPGRSRKLEALPGGWVSCWTILRAGLFGLVALLVIPQLVVRMTKLSVKTVPWRAPFRSWHLASCWHLRSP